MYANILFDLDGTLTDSSEGIIKCIQYALEDFGITAQPDELTPFIGPPLVESFARFYDFTPEEAQRALVLYRERFSTVGLFENRLYPGAEQMLRSLHAEDVKLALSTAKPEVYAQSILEHFEIDGYFDVIAGATLDGKRIHKAEVVADCLERLSFPAEKDCIMVGDRRDDIEGARRCGLDTIAVSWGFADEGEFDAHKPLMVVHDFDQLEAAILA